MLTSCCPSTIWLQWHGDGDPSDPGPVSSGEVTWSTARVFESELEFVNAEEIRRALQGHRRAELFGEAGCISATMRALAHGDRVRDAVENLRDAKGRHNTEQAYRRLMDLFQNSPQLPPPPSPPEKEKGAEPFQIQRPSLAPALGLTQSDLDDLFRLAAGISA